MNINAIKAFVITTELGSISAAAKAMNKGRVQVSQWIANLELDWGIELFDRAGHKPVLTEQGQALLDKASSILQLSEKLASHVEKINGSGAGCIRLGITTFIDPKIVSHLIHQLRDIDAEMDLQIEFSPCDDLIASTDYDFIISHYPYSGIGHWEFMNVTQRQFVSVCAPQHSIAQLDEVSTEQLSQHLAIAITQQNESLWGSYKFDTMSVNNVATARQLAKDGIGWICIDQDSIKHELNNNELVIINHREAIQRSKFGLGYRDSHCANGIREVLYNVLRQHVSH
ncbi:LysR family transcriptional regulator [Vibrio mediterranei]|uniref:LysR family transcriptional regulator n=1 Tax=Vibrio TaxID=662 RepID=UPI0017B472D1|nr:MULTISPECIES: LysR family transcriptional regulator [Vibrio]MCF4175462.1 LysR family transcriptional regulator [Vibrio sp. McD22-P3]MCY9854657.1 LysR family transcriptional regulator [Vibrio mediterranei]NUW74097.1 LysR family transcriptional regulator [Vibrio mediterranei]